MTKRELLKLSMIPFLTSPEKLQAAMTLNAKPSEYTMVIGGYRKDGAYIHLTETIKLDNDRPTQYLDCQPIIDTVIEVLTGSTEYGLMVKLLAKERDCANFSVGNWYTLRVTNGKIKYESLLIASFVARTFPTLPDRREGWFFDYNGPLAPNTPDLIEDGILKLHQFEGLQYCRRQSENFSKYTTWHAKRDPKYGRPFGEDISL